MIGRDRGAVGVLAGTVLAEELAAVSLGPGRRLEQPDLRGVQVGAVWLVGAVHHRGDPRVAEALQVRGDLAVGSAVQVGVAGREPDVEPGLGLGRDLVACLIRGADARQADRGPPGPPARAASP